jgi:undecaprenyl diphosphate synthase
MNKTGAVPRHVAVIMDGNGRWAEARGRPRMEGHRAGLDSLQDILQTFGERGVDYVTLYAFSTENWGRPLDEIEGLMELLADAIERQTGSLHSRGVRILHLGRMDRLDGDLARSIEKTVALTKDNTGLTLSVAFDYGGRDELLETIKEIVRQGHRPEDIDEDLVNRYLYTAQVPDPDLLIRTGGEMRLSNFLLWQAAYTEFYSTKVLWPDFGPADVHSALDAYAARERRFGTVASEA